MDFNYFEIGYCINLSALQNEDILLEEKESNSETLEPAVEASICSL